MGKQVGIFIRDLRIKRGLSQGEVARLLDLKTAQSISNIERGVSPLPRAKIKRLAEVLGVRRNEIVAVVLQEVQDRYSRAAGVKLSDGLSRDERVLLESLASRLRTAKAVERSALMRQMRRLVP
jgi:transcriptional regulator with XRE-family HTH domain